MVIQKSKSRFPAVPFKWRTREEGDVAPKDMKTSHLFYALRMLWNNCAPPDKRVGKVKLYRFGPFYTSEYVREAVTQMSRELATRDDLPEWAIEELRQMAMHLREGLLLEGGK